VHFREMEQQGGGSTTPKRKLMLEDDDEDMLAVATTNDDANAYSDLQYLPLPNSGGWYAHFDHREGSIELGRLTMLAATAPPAAVVGSSEMLLVPTQWQQKPRSGGPCDARLFDWRWTGGTRGRGDTRRVAGTSL
jgi:hypothetical protein